MIENRLIYQQAEVFRPEETICNPEYEVCNSTRQDLDSLNSEINQDPERPSVSPEEIAILIQSPETEASSDIIRRSLNIPEMLPVDNFSSQEQFRELISSIFNELSPEEIDTYLTEIEDRAINNPNNIQTNLSIEIRNSREENEILRLSRSYQALDMFSTYALNSVIQNYPNRYRLSTEEMAEYLRNRSNAELFQTQQELLRFGEPYRQHLYINNPEYIGEIERRGDALLNYDAQISDMYYTHQQQVESVRTYIREHGAEIRNLFERTSGNDLFISPHILISYDPESQNISLNYPNETKFTRPLWDNYDLTRRMLYADRQVDSSYSATQEIYDNHQELEEISHRINGILETGELSDSQREQLNNELEEAERLLEELDSLIETQRLLYASSELWLGVAPGIGEWNDLANMSQNIIRGDWGRSAGDAFFYLAGAASDVISAGAIGSGERAARESVSATRVLRNLIFNRDTWAVRVSRLREILANNSGAELTALTLEQAGLWGGIGFATVHSRRYYNQEEVFTP